MYEVSKWISGADFMYSAIIYMYAVAVQYNQLALVQCALKLNFKGRTTFFCACHTLCVFLHLSYIKYELDVHGVCDKV
jgi:hypothetical protein